jgi:hypothetical protein
VTQKRKKRKRKRKKRNHSMVRFFPLVVVLLTFFAIDAVCKLYGETNESKLKINKNKSAT